MDKLNKYYIAGPMTGIAGYNAKAFRAAALDLRARGLEVVSPVEIAESLPASVGSLPYEVYARESMKGMLDCTHIVLLPHWGGSRGAQMELKVADFLRMKVMFYEGDSRSLQPSGKYGDLSV